MRSCKTQDCTPRSATVRPAAGVIGANHRSAPISVRERLSVAPAELPEMLARVGQVTGVREVALLSTCNRVELYTAAEPGQEVLDLVAAELCQAKGVGFGEVEPCLYRRDGLAAARHIFEVACGLDSMVPGENEVLGQLKAAYAAAARAGTAGPELSRLFQKAFKVAKDVRSRTGISRRKVSIGTVVADLAHKVFGSLGHVRVALIGAGEVAELVVKSLASEEAEIAVIANRSLESARRLCSAYGGEAITLESAGQEALGADILVTSVAAQGAVVARERVAGAARARRGRPMLLVDLGVPRNVSPEVADLDGVILYNIDDLQHVVETNVAYRLEQADQAEVLISEEVGKFAAQLRADEVAETISRLCSELTRVGEDECARALGRLGDLTDEQRREVGLMVHRIVRKLLHSPIEVLKEEARCGNGAEMEQSVRRLFRI